MKTGTKAPAKAWDTAELDDGIEWIEYHLGGDYMSVHSRPAETMDEEEQRQAVEAITPPDQSYCIDRKIWCHQGSRRSTLKVTEYCITIWLPDSAAVEASECGHKLVQTASHESFHAAVEEARLLVAGVMS